MINFKVKTDKALGFNCIKQRKLQKELIMKFDLETYAANIILK